MVKLGKSQVPRERRVRLALRVDFHAGDSRSRRGQTNDLTVGGAFVECESPPPPGTRVWLSVHSPTSWDPLEITCDVRWATKRDAVPSGFGVRFEDLSQVDEAALGAFLSRMTYGAEA